MRILSVDLASNRYKDIGVAVFVEASTAGLRGRPCVTDVTRWLTELAVTTALVGVDDLSVGEIGAVVVIQQST